jgi:hypothetical protein
MASRPHIPKFPQFQNAEKEPAKVEAELKKIRDEEEDDESEERDSEFLPTSASVSSFFASYVHF